MVASRQERAAGRLLDDETLRGDLTDDEFQPLQDWALATSDRLAAATTASSDDAAWPVIDAGLERIREAVRTAGAAVFAMHEQGHGARDAELRELRRVAGPPLVSVEKADAVVASLEVALHRIMADQELAGSELARAIADALDALTADAGGEPSAADEEEAAASAREAAASAGEGAAAS